jgi:hypothetical protein
MTFLILIIQIQLILHMLITNKDLKSLRKDIEYLDKEVIHLKRKLIYFNNKLTGLK